MQFIFLKTKRQLLNKVLELQKENKEIRETVNFFKRQYDYKTIQLTSKNDTIRYLEGQLEHEKAAADGYKKAYEELKETTKETNFTINQINADVWKIIKGKTLKETHKCTEECFVKHVMPAIQRDYDSINPKYKEDNGTINDFLNHWEKRLKETYDFIYSLYIGRSGIVLVSFKYSI